MSDTFSRTVYHRKVITNDTPLLTLAERVRLLGLERTIQAKRDRLNGLVSVFGAKDIELGFYGLGDDNGTFVATVVGIPPLLDRSVEAQAPEGPRLLRLGVFTVTLGTSTETNKNPIIGLADAGTWRAADTIETSITGTGIRLYDAEGGNGVARIVLDPLQCPLIYVYISAMTNVTRVDVSARRVSQFR